MAGISGSSALGLVFTDIEGSSALWERFGDRFMGAVEAHNQVVTEACQHHGGRVIKEEGDAFFLVFPTPMATVAFALEAQDRLRRHPWAAGDHPELQVRMGLHYGTPIPRGEDYFGPEVNRTARICDAGHGGQVLVTEALLEACGELGDGAVVTDIGRHRLRGLAEAQHLYQLTRADWDRQTWPVLRTLDHIATNLPAQVTSFIGREPDLERLAALFANPEERLITLTGPGGSGKSRLAQRAAGEALQHFPDGVYWVELAPLTTPESVPGAIAGALGLQLSPEVRPLETLAVHLREREVLLALDNLEQVIEAAEFLEQLLTRAPKLRLLVTSRELLRVPGEHVHEVLPLPLPTPPVNLDTLSQHESVRLFLERAQAAEPGFIITADNAAAIAELCLRLDGIPLALELAAAWTRMLTPRQILEQLGPGSRVLSSRVRGVAERQRTLRESIEWSYRLLDEADRETFRRLAVFHDGFFLDAAETVCGRGALLSVSNLRDRSLVLAREALGQQRYYLLETVREFAAQQLAAEGEEDEARERHAEHYAGVARRLMYVWNAPESTPLWTEYRLEAHNLINALDTEVTSERTDRLDELLRGAGDLATCMPSTAAPAGSAQRAFILAQRHISERWTATAAFALCRLSSEEAVLSQVGSWVRACDEAGEAESATLCIRLAIGYALRSGDHGSALRWAEEVERRGSAGIPNVARSVGACFSALGLHQRAIALLRAAADDLVAGGAPAFRQQYLLSQLSLALVLAGEVDAARQTAARAMSLAPDAGHGFFHGAAGNWRKCALAFAVAGQPAEARSAFDAAKLLLEAHCRATEPYADMAVDFVQTHVAAEMPELALEFDAAVLAAWPPFALHEHRLQSLAAALAEACARCDRPDDARRYALIALDYSPDGIVDEYHARELLKHLGWPLLVLGHPEDAARCGALARRLSCGQPELLRRCAGLLAAVRQRLDAAAYQRACAAAETTAVPAALALARRALAG